MLCTCTGWLNETLVDHPAIYQFDAMGWDGMRWDAMRSDGMRCHPMRCDGLNLWPYQIDLAGLNSLYMHIAWWVLNEFDLDVNLVDLIVLARSGSKFSSQY